MPLDRIIRKRHEKKNFLDVAAIYVLASQMIKINIDKMEERKLVNNR